MIMTRAIYLLLFLAAALASHGYDFLTRAGLRWRAGDIPMSLQLDTTMAAGTLTDGNTSWNEVAQQALDLWNEHLGTRVQFTTFTSVEHGDGNDHNEVFFSPDIYGHRFGAQVLAVTSTWHIGNERVEGDTIFNDAIQWDSYRGPSDFTVVDLRRVAAHEFGHTLGLDHPNEARQIVVALMNSTVSDLDTLAADDIHGVRALYPPNEKYALTLDVFPPGSGEVLATPAPDVNNQYQAGTLVTLTAKPHRGFRFNFWGGDENLAARRLKVLVVDDETITVNFSTNGAPVIVAQPRSQFASYNDTVTLSARVSSRPPTAYQWQHDGDDVPGTSNTTLVLRFVGHEDSGLYSLRATNARGTTFSKPARVIVEGY